MTRSLDPLDGESLGGYLLRLAQRHRLSPIKLARHLGLIPAAGTQLSRRLLLDVDTGTLAHAAQLGEHEAAALTLAAWAFRYPPILRALSPGTGERPSRDDWLFNDVPRYCPHCLTGDGSAIQQQFGGPWKRAWHLPIAFACPGHQAFLQHGCPSGHQPLHVITKLIIQPGDSTLHPTQCRQPRSKEYSARRGRRRRPCGIPLDQSPGTRTLLRPTESMLDIQQRLLSLLDPRNPPEEASRRFTDLRVLAALLCDSWPLGRELIEDLAVPAVIDHIRSLDTSGRRLRDRPPTSAIATAALLTAAAGLRDSADLHEELGRHVRATPWAGRPSGAPWAKILTRHRPACSETLLQAADPLTRTFQRTGFRGTKAPVHTVGYRPEHIPAFLEDDWYQRYLAPMQCGRCVKTARRTAAVTLVQWAAGGSAGDAADFLGVNPGGGQYPIPASFYRWLTGIGPACFPAALRQLAQELHVAEHPIDYRRRRQALRDWYLTSDAWQNIADQLPPVPGPVQPALDDRMRQEASAFIWAYVTRGEPQFAPRPVEAAQPEHVRQSWLRRRASTWSKLRSSPVNHYKALRQALIHQGQHLICKLDSQGELSSPG